MVATCQRAVTLFPITRHLKSSDFLALLSFLLNCQNSLKMVCLAIVQGVVGLSLYILRYALKSSIFVQNWHGWIHLEENIHPFVFLK